MRLNSGGPGADLRERMTTPFRPRRIPRVVRRVSGGLAAVTLLGVAGCLGPAPAPAPPVTTTSSTVAPTVPAGMGPVPVTGTPRVTAAQLVAWFDAKTSHGTGYVATVPVATLAQTYLDEGAAEGLAGDVAFVQGVLETGWFRFSGSVPASYNNFAGIGATDVNPAPAQFATAQVGVRAQIQHLRAYADATATTCTAPPLHNPCVDPRFALVMPKGKAAKWNEFGNGNWATDPAYAAKILTLYAQLLTYNHVPLP